MTRSRIRRPEIFLRHAFATAATLLLSFSLTAAASGQPEPSKAKLIETLRAILPLLEAGNLDEAAKWVVLPEGVEPKALAGLVAKREISAAGIDILERDAEFGPAVQMFGPKRAEALCKKMGVGTESVYGFNHQQGDVYGEVLALWEGGKFKLVRLDDVGKYDVTQTPAESDQNADDASRQPAPKSDTIESIAAQLPALEAKVTGNPDDIVARATYAQALFIVKNYPLAWKQLMIGHKQQPNHAGIARGIDAMISTLTSLGVLGVGVPTETIAGLLTEPEQKVDLKNNRERWVYGHWGIDFKDGRILEIIDLRGATSELYEPTEIISVDLDGRQWTTGFRKKTASRVSAMMFLPGDTVAKHTESVAIERMLDAANFGTMEEIAKRVVADEQKASPGAKHKILMVDEQTAIIAAEFPIAGSENSSHELIRLFKADKDVHRLHYLKKSKAAPSPEYQQKWLKLFQAAQLQPVNDETP